MNDQRIAVEPSPIPRGAKVRISYRGLLPQSGAESCWLHYGFDGWQTPATIPMMREPDNSFHASVTATGSRELNFCFKDSAANWDNNNGWDWSCPIY
ncbi:MAG TPA: carbohydrate-binding protein [Bacillota bacterium]|nr:carbohydrate-binding protein [Bacillota bacterium]HQD39559.1 carbohydrate-binding protein [Bacillota bacterium]